MASRQAKAEFLLILCTFVWGATFVVVKSGLVDISPMLLIAIRFTAASLFFLPFCCSSLKRLDRRSAVDGVVLGLLLFVGFAAQTTGLQYTTASKSGFITGMLVVFTPLFQLGLERRSPKLGNIIGVVLVSVGLYLLTSPEGTQFNRGDALTLACAIVFGLYIVYLDIFSKRSDVALLTFLQMLTSAVLAWIIAAGWEDVRLQITVHLLLALAFLSVLATVVTLALQTTYQKDTTPTRAAIIFSLEPVFSAVLAYWVIGERMGRLGVLGGAAILAGLLISELSGVMFRSRTENRLKASASARGD